MYMSIHNVTTIETETYTVEKVEGKIVKLVISHRDRTSDDKILKTEIKLFTDPCEFKGLLIES